MKTEHEFNAYLSKELKKLKPAVYAQKMSDRFAVGVSDFLLFHNGRATVFETKFVRELPKRNGKVLSHAFDGKQLTYFKSISNTGNSAFGVVGVGEEKTAYVIPFYNIPESGNWTAPELKSSAAGVFFFSDVAGMAKFMSNFSGSFSQDLLWLLGGTRA